jgi:hypothetical protein
VSEPTAIGWGPNFFEFLESGRNKIDYWRIYTLVDYSAARSALPAGDL